MTLVEITSKINFVILEKTIDKLVANATNHVFALKKNNAFGKYGSPPSTCENFSILELSFMMCHW